MSRKYNAVSSVVNFVSCFNDFITSTTNCVLTKISTIGNNVTYARIFEGNLALTVTLISETIYTISSSSSTPHSSCSTMSIETWAQSLITPQINPLSQA